MFGSIFTIRMETQRNDLQGEGGGWKSRVFKATKLLILNDIFQPFYLNFKNARKLICEHEIQSEGSQSKIHFSYMELPV